MVIIDVSDVLGVGSRNIWFFEGCVDGDLVIYNYRIWC